MSSFSRFPMRDGRVRAGEGWHNGDASDRSDRSAAVHEHLDHRMWLGAWKRMVDVSVSVLAQPFLRSFSSFFFNASDPAVSFSTAAPLPTAGSPLWRGECNIVDSATLDDHQMT